MAFAEVLGIGVDEVLVEQWRDWFAPLVQPFRTDLLPPEVAAAVPVKEAMPSAPTQSSPQSACGQAANDAPKGDAGVAVRADQVR